ncbi:MAG TPA: trehalose-phosphatase [Longimicrobiales bacterium]
MHGAILLYGPDTDSEDRGQGMGIPHAMQKLDGWRAARRRTGRMLLALDFDGTLVPIAPRPEAAVLSGEARSLVARLAARPDTDVAVVSGRALEDIRAKVGLDGVYYAGNHGLEIEGPGVQRVHADAVAARPRIEACAAELREALAGIEGVVLEDKGVTLSVHYRLVASEEEVARVRATVLRVCGGREGVRITEGKRVLEARPAADWDKGHATRFLLKALELDALPRSPAIFIGDDLTDEDAFRALRGRGDGVLVAAGEPSETAATAVLHSTDEVLELLAALAEPADAEPS